MLSAASRSPARRAATPWAKTVARLAFISAEYEKERGRSNLLRPLWLQLPERYFVGLLRFHSCQARHSSNSRRSDVPADSCHFLNSSSSETLTGSRFPARSTFQRRSPHMPGRPSLISRLYAGPGSVEGRGGT